MNVHNFSKHGYDVKFYEYANYRSMTILKDGRAVHRQTRQNSPNNGAYPFSYMVEDAEDAIVYLLSRESK